MTAIVKASKEVKGVASTVRTHLDAVERARALFLATMKRAESDYFERIKRATPEIAGEEVAAGNGAATESSDTTPATP